MADDELGRRVELRVQKRLAEIYLSWESPGGPFSPEAAAEQARKNAESMKHLETAVRRVEEILRSHGIRMKVDGCGCCESPRVSFAYNDEVIACDTGCFMLDTFNN